MGHLRVNMHRIKTYLGVLIAVSIFFCLFRTLFLTWRMLGAVWGRFQLPWMFASFATLLVYSGLSVKPWLAFLSQLGVDLGYRNGFQIYYLSKLGRYLPGKVWFLFGRIYLCQKVGIGKTAAIFSTVFELGVLTFSGLLISLFVFRFTLTRYLPSPANMRFFVPLFLTVFFVGVACLACFWKKILPSFHPSIHPSWIYLHLPTTITPF